MQSSPRRYTTLSVTPEVKEAIDSHPHKEPWMPYWAFLNKELDLRVEVE